MLSPLLPPDVSCKRKRSVLKNTDYKQLEASKKSHIAFNNSSDGCYVEWLFAHLKDCIKRHQRRLTVLDHFDAIATKYHTAWEKSIHMMDTFVHEQATKMFYNIMQYILTVEVVCRKLVALSPSGQKSQTGLFAF